ncbi:MAG: serine hydrolase [Planctomycetes bacterium]|nr:serine hydrolase [Planctomycetota bacterium]
MPSPSRAPESRPFRSSLVALACAGICGLFAAPRAQDPRASAALARLTLEERAAQLLMCWTLTRNDDAYPLRDTVRRHVAELGIGGVILSIGELADAPALIADLQARARLPLLCAGDFETGLAFRLRGATEFGPAMLLGAADSVPLAHAAGLWTGREARALGFHWVFGPVLDVNVNPANPVIQVRSFGEDPARVAALGSAFAEGIAEAGVVATAKHFPGHGDVATDSHKALPRVTGDRARLDAVELLPFTVAIDRGLGSIMTGHLAVPALTGDDATPATLSPAVLTGLLRERLGFRGVIVTDALEMGGLAAVSPVEAAILALQAGADLLLIPPEPRATRDAIAAAVRSGRVPAARLDEACLRILDLKARAGLLDGTPPRGDAMGIPTAEATATAARIAQFGITLLRDPGARLPLRASSLVLIEYVDDKSDESGGSFRAGLADLAPDFTALRLSADATADDVARARGILADARARGATPILGLRTRRRVPVDAVRPLLGAVGDDAVIVSFGNPYIVDLVAPGTTVLLAYGTSPSTAEAAARALGGTGPALGRLPVTIPGQGVRGDGLSLLPPARTLPRVAAAEHGFAPEFRARVVERLERAIAERVAPGAVVLVARRGEVVLELAVGRETYDADAKPITSASRFDLASLTKVCATTPAVLRLVALGKLELDARVATLLPGFEGEHKDAVTVRHLLTHSAGLPPFERWFATLSGRDAILAAAKATPLVAPPGTVTRYSDIGMILLGALVEQLSGEALDVFVKREVFAPLGMDRAGYAKSGAPIDAVPTEDCAWRKRLIRGEVHDENAYALGGVAGHAGLFASADDVAKLGIAFLGGGRGVWPPALVREAVRRQGLVEGSSRALGWDGFVAAGSGGSRLSPESFGHTGFTGTSLWCDPRRDLVVVLLTNRVHPSRDNDRHVALRRELADLVVESMTPR